MPFTPASGGKIAVTCDVCLDKHTMLTIAGVIAGQWKTDKYRGVPGIVCPECVCIIDTMWPGDLQALITSTRVANALTS